MLVITRTAVSMITSLTDGCNNLSFHAELVLESTSKVADTALTIACNIWNLPDVIEHLSTGEQEDGNQTDGSPEVSVLDNGQNVGRQNSEQGDGTHHNCHCRDEAHIIEGSNQRGLGAIRQVTTDPSVQCLGANWTVIGGKQISRWFSKWTERNSFLPGEVISHRLGVQLGERSNGRRKQEKHGCGLEHKLLEVQIFSFHANSYPMASIRLV